MVNINNTKHIVGDWLLSVGLALRFNTTKWCSLMLANHCACIMAISTVFIVLATLVRLLCFHFLFYFVEEFIFCFILLNDCLFFSPSFEDTPSAQPSPVLSSANRSKGFSNLCQIFAWLVSRIIIYFMNSVI